MGLLEAQTIDDLMHSSTPSKGIERTMERMIHELEMDSIYIVLYEEHAGQPEVVFEWESTERKRKIDFTVYFESVLDWYHFDESDMYIAGKTAKLSKDESKMYTGIGYKSVVEFQMKNHGNIIGYVLIGWNRCRELSEEEGRELHVLLKLMNESIIQEFHTAVMGEIDERLFKLACNVTKTMIYMVDEDNRIQFVNNYAKDEYPDIKVGDYSYKVFRGDDASIEKCPFQNLEKEQYVDELMYLPYLGDSFRVNSAKVMATDKQNAYMITLQRMSDFQPMDDRGITGKKFAFALKQLYKDIIAVEIRRDTFHDLFSEDINNQYSYSMDFVLKWLSKVHPDDKQKFLECFDINFLQSAFESGVGQKEIDFRYRTHEGTYHCMNGQILFEHNTNKDVTVYVLFQDIEALRSTQIEEAKKIRESLMAARSAAELKGQVLANISHEIRTPMSGIISMSSVAKQVYKEEDRLLECLSNIDHYAEHMMMVMDSMLESVKVDKDAINIARQPFRLDTFMNRVDMEVRERIEKKNVQFHIESKCQVKQLLGDEIRLQQVMCTLINNAISYTPISGEIKVTAQQIAIDNKTAYIRFMIDDTGNGLTDKMKESIFGFSHNKDNGFIDEEYFDLSLAARVVQLMGGQIGVDVNASGTHLYFTIPFDMPETDKQNKSIKKKEFSEFSNFKGKRILIAEDSDLAQDALRAVLEVVGMEVDTVDNGKKAVIQFISKPAFTYDAVLMDVHMPIMDGREATRCIRISGKEDGETVPIIGLMANTYDEDIDNSLEAGMQQHLSKPVDVDTLYKVLSKLIPENEDEEQEE